MARAMYPLCILLLPLLLLTGGHGAPQQCQQLSNIVPNCTCDSALINNVPDNLKVVINCRGQGLTQMPVIAGASTHEIYEMTLADNSLQSIPANAFQGLRIQRLDLRGNRLIDIAPGAFKGLENDLMELHIGGDKNGQVPPPINSLTNLTRLHTLTLEHFRFAGDALDQGVLVHFESLETLTLAYNHLTFIEPLSVPVDLITLTLDHQALENLPVDFLRSHILLQSLTITNTNITDITYHAFEKNTRLAHLDLGFNKITNLYDSCFKGLETSLLYLSLRNNPIDQVNVLNSVQELGSLQTLHLSYINLKTLPATPGFLQNKGSLSTLYLDNCQLTSLAANVFSSATSLTTLRLSHNQIATMDDQSLSGLTRLRFLDLSYQNIGAGRTLTLPASLSQSTLQQLVLTGTAVTPSVLWQRVSTLTGQTILKLDNTGLDDIPDYAFMSLSNLQELYLDNNNLSNITQEKLAGLRNLQKLHLSNNNIQTLSNCTFHDHPLDPALELTLLGNPLLCDCRLRWLLEEQDANRIELSGVEMCAGPTDKAGKWLGSFQPADLTCSSNWTPDTCQDLYTTSMPPTTTPTPTVIITVANSTKTSITITWQVINDANIAYFRVRMTELDTSNIRISGNLPTTQSSYTTSGVTAGKSYSLCVLTYLATSSGQPSSTQCVEVKVMADQLPSNQDDDSSDTYIIIGIVVAGVILLVFIVAIIYLIFLKKRTKKADVPQAHYFTPSELPSMGAEAKRFTRPKQQQPKVGRALDQENIKVTVISDGQTGPGSARLSAGSYQYLDQKSVQPMPDAMPSTSHYANDVRGRSLPSYPDPTANGDTTAGYYEMGANAGPANQRPYHQINDR